MTKTGPAAAGAAMKARGVATVGGGPANGYRLLVGGREWRTNEGEALTLASRALAEAVVAEWNDAGDDAGVGGRTLLRLAATERLVVAPDRAGAVAQLRAAAHSDMLCYRAVAPAALVGRQHAAWQPFLDWFAGETGVPLAVTEGVMPASQPAPAQAAVAALLEGLDDATLSALLAAVPALGSLVLALAMLAGRVSPEAAGRIATLDAAWEEEQWGGTGEAARTARRLATDLASVRRFLALRREA